MNTLKILFLTLIGSSTMYAQDPDPVLFEDLWYLTELVVDGNSIDIPQTSEIETVLLYFLTDSVVTDACNRIGTLLVAFTDTSFTTDNWGFLKSNCFLQSTIDFENFYFDDFYQFNPPFGDVFTYTIVSGPNDDLMLTVTNSEGDIAVYGNPALGIEDVTQNAFTLYPNPASEKVFLQLLMGMVAQEVRLYDVQGRLMSQEVLNQTRLIEIGTTSLRAGLYFIQVIDDKGQVSVERFVKQ